MKKVLVRDWMTKDPIAIPPTTPLPQVYQLMRKHNIRRLPIVVDEKPVGIVTLGDVREARPSGATSLSIYEINYLLSSLEIGDIMTENPFTVTPDDSLHDAAKIMLENKIGGLPVVEDGKLVGIITESDIFRAVIEIIE